jgi:hypothetical protein
LFQPRICRSRPARADRSAFALAALLAALFAVPAAAQGAGENLLANPSFEETGTLTMPAGWDSTGGDLPTAGYLWDTAEARTGSHSVRVINTSNYFPSWHNWNQMLLGVNHLAGQEVTLRGWYKARDLSGKAYVLVQAYRDTVVIEAIKAAVPRRVMREHMGYTPQGDPAVELGWGRKYVSGDRAEWTPIEVTLFIPPSTNVIYVRAGVLGVGQAWFDDLSLTPRLAAAEKPFPIGRNLLVDPGFESDFNVWDYSLAPVEGLSIRPDTTARTGLQSCLIEAPRRGQLALWSHVYQVFNTRILSGKRVRFSGWLKLEGLDNSYALLSIFTTGMYGTHQNLGSESFSGTKDWTFSSIEFDVPADTYAVWVRAAVSTSKGRVWYDDLNFEVVGDVPRSDAGQRNAPKRAASGG